jgi:hypothetical protein
MIYLEASARIVDRYRYTLVRRWSARLLEEPRIVWVMLNPSTADGTEDDPTLRKVVGFSKRWGYGSALVVNLAALRATDPRELRAAEDPVGIENPGWLWRALHGSPVIAAWGDGVRHLPRGTVSQVLVELVASRGGFEWIPWRPETTLEKVRLRP